jgi:hypothetical protein
MSKQILRYSKQNYNDVCNILKDDLGFEDFFLVSSADPIVSKPALIKRMLLVLLALLRSGRSLRLSNQLACIGIECIIPVLLLNKLRLVSSNRIYLWGMFFHNQTLHKRFHAIMRPLVRENITLILFSKHETNQWTTLLRNKIKVRYVPYGRLGDDPEVEPIAKDYYFAGGYSNRDYLPLIEVFANRQENLIIVCSTQNRELESVSGAANITIYRDLAEALFEKLLAEAKAVIFPFKYNTGAAGQSVMLRCMRSKKLVICSDTEIIREYVTNQETGIIVADIKRDLPDVITSIEYYPSNYKDYGTNLHKHYKANFSSDVFVRNIKNVFGECTVRRAEMSEV